MLPVLPDLNEELGFTVAVLLIKRKSVLLLFEAIRDKAPSCLDKVFLD